MNQQLAEQLRGADNMSKESNKVVQHMSRNIKTHLNIIKWLAIFSIFTSISPLADANNMGDQAAIVLYSISIVYQGYVLFIVHTVLKKI